MIPGMIDFRAFAPLPATLKQLAERSSYKRHFRSFDTEDSVRGIQEYRDTLQRLGISHQLVSGAGAPLEELMGLAREAGCLIPIADISVSDGGGLSPDLNDVINLGYRLVGIAPYRSGHSADDQTFYPLYSKCSELGIGVIVHASTHLSADRPMKLGHPEHLDQVAIDFPELILVASHGGWPWVPEMVALGMRHPNLYIELSGQASKYYTEGGSGWEVLMRYARGPLKRKILWGSVAPFFDLEDQVTGAHSLKLDENIKVHLLTENPRRVLESCGIELK